MAVKRTRFLCIRVTDGEYQQPLERCNGRQLAVWMRGNLVSCGARRGRYGRRPSIRFAARQLPDGTTSTRSPEINGGSWSGADCPVRAAHIADAELERLRHAVLEKADDDSAASSARARRQSRAGGLSAGKDRQRDGAIVLQGKP